MNIRTSAPAAVALCLLTAPAALAVVTTTAVNGPVTSPPTNITWQLQGLTVRGKMQPLPTALNRPTLVFTGLSASGVAQCNTFRATYASRADILRFGPTAATKKSCKAILNTLETQYLKLLAGTNRYTVSGSTLTLYSGSRSRLVYTQLKK